MSVYVGGTPEDVFVSTPERFVEMTCVVCELPLCVDAAALPAKDPPETSVPRTESTMRSVMEVVRTAAMLCEGTFKCEFCGRGWEGRTW